ncbi:MAG: hypothetical protein NXI04_20520 [Planctomycetaceae bacterium]|nr:hypothetical protein [Planctomycetaceae bacterium]
MPSTSLNENASDMPPATAQNEQSEAASDVSQTLDVAIEHMLAELEPADRQATDATAERTESTSPQRGGADHEATDIQDALTPINATLRQQSEALVGLTQALQGLQLAVADLQFANRSASGPTVDSASLPVPEAGQATALDNDETPDPDAQPQASQEQCWDQIKAALLKGDASVVPEAESLPEAEAPPKEDDLPYDVQYDLVPHAEILQMDAEQLRKLLLDQERVISRLVQSARAEKKATISLTPEDLRANADDMPEELANQVRATLKTLDEQARLGELELSLERARISRQLSHLEDTRQILESNARALGLEIGPEGRIVGDLKSVRNGGTKNRRWLGALGFGD